MNPTIDYFTGEKSESFLFLVLGLVGLAMCIYIFVSCTFPFWKGFAVPLALVSVLEIVVGATLIYRTPKDVMRVENYIQNEKLKIKTDEIPRMEKVMKNFELFRYMEIALIVVGMLVFFVFQKNEFWKGLGLGLLIQSSIVLTLDGFAERRGSVYLEFLKSIGNG
jgi:hypothetical protein